MSALIDDRPNALVLPVTKEAKAIAERFARLQPTSEKAEQVRFNTLAVSVVHNYLKMMGIATDPTTSDSWNPFVCLGTNTADLVVTGLGRLECRSVQASDQTCYIPQEVWSDRIGYVVVQLDEVLEEAAILGFISTVTTENVPLQQVRSLRDLLRHLHSLMQSQPSTQRRTNLSQWFQEAFEAGWQAVESLLAPADADLAFSFRNSGLPTEPATQKRRARPIELAGMSAQPAMILIIEISSMLNSSEQTSNLQIQIGLQVMTHDRQVTLPNGLQFAVLDESGNIFLQTQAEVNDDYLRLQFTGMPGEHFSVRVNLGDAAMTENFVI